MFFNLKDGDKMSKKLNKNTFMQGAFIATLGIVISKILGMIYVIPFYAIIGESGGALYGYAYNIYSIFLSISTAGIPLAISSITSEYNTLGQYANKEKTFRIAKRYLNVIGIISFIVLFVFAKDIAYLIIGNNTGGNSIEDITFVIRTISLSILVVPTLSVYRGYLQGHKYITPTSKSQVLEQIIRVLVIIAGSFAAVKIFDLDIKYAVAIALFGATIGSVVSYLYLVFVRKKHKEELNTDVDVATSDITAKAIFKKVIWVAFPFIFCDVCKSLYNSVDTFFVVRTLTGLGYETTVAESVMSIISTWGNKLNMIVVAIGTGFAVSLIPNITSSLVLKDYKDVNVKINQTFKTLFYTTIPMTVGLSFLSVPVWNSFYGASTYGPIVFRFSIIVALVTVILSATQVIALTFKEYKILLPSVVAGLVLNGVLDIPLMLLLDKMGIYAFYGATLSTCLGHILTIWLVLHFIKKKYSLSLKESYKSGFKSLLFTGIMIGILYLASLVLPLDSTNRLISVLIVVGYAVAGAIIYFVLTYKFKLIHEVFGEDFLTKIKNKFMKRGI